MAELPTGTVTFMLTDLVSSTRLWEETSDELMNEALGRHDGILRETIERHGGTVFATMGDGVAAVFGSAADALGAALNVQRRLADPESEPAVLRARVALHSDEGRLRAPGQYVNRPINRCARLMAIAHGGQVLVSGATAVVGRSGLPPGAALVDLGEHRLRDLAEPMHVFQLVHPGIAAEFPPLRSIDRLPGNLPRQVTSFVGRDHELKRVVELVRERPLVTLTGVGGVGKTRLAVQVAAEVAADFADGAWLCELGSVSDPNAVWETLAASLGVLPSAGRRIEEVLLEFLGPKRLLVVLDNCEHLLGSVAAVADAISHRCHDVVVLATSREGLALAGEQMVAVPPLAVPAERAERGSLAQVDAVQLFGDRALDATTDFVLSDRNVAAVGQLCRRLDGIPLAIELAAARVRSLPPEELVARLDQRFRLLTRGSRAALERHQTLRNTIDWSYDLLSRAERTALNRVSVFAGGWDLGAAEAVVSGDEVDRADVVDLLGALVDKSLVDVDAADGRARYRLLETIRQYAQERLEASGETTGVRDHHLDHYVEVSEAAGPRLRSRDQLACCAALLRDTDNVRAALDWAVEASLPDLGLRLVIPLMATGIPLGWTANDWAASAASIDGAANHDLYPLAVAFAAMGATLRGDLDRAAQLVATAEEAQGRLGTDHLWVHAAAGVLAFFQGEVERSVRHYQAWVELARQTGDPYEISQSLSALASALSMVDSPGAAVIAEEAVHVAREAGIPGTLLYALIVLGSRLANDEPSRAPALLDEAVEVAAALGDRQTIATTIMQRGWLAAAQQDWPTALSVTTRAAEECLQAGNLMTLGAALRTAAAAFVGMQRFEPAAVIIGACDARFGLPRLDGPVGIQDAATRSSVLGALGNQRFTELKARGAELTLPGAVAYLRGETDSALA
jgi:predicted ATPase/class 3 adenylate cyclase